MEKSGQLHALIVLTRRGKRFGIHWVGLRIILDVAAKRKIFHCRNPSRALQTVTSRYIDLASVFNCSLFPFPTAALKKHSPKFNVENNAVLWNATLYSLLLYWCFRNNILLLSSGFKSKPSKMQATIRGTCLLLVWLLFDTEDGSNIFLHNVCKFL
jgi:hypothetical protein